MHELGSSASVGLKKLGTYLHLNGIFRILFWSCSGVYTEVCHLGAEHQAPKWRFPRTENPKLCSQNAIKVQLPHFLSPTEALEPTSCLLMNLLCILYNFDIQV